MNINYTPLLTIIWTDDDEIHHSAPRVYQGGNKIQSPSKNSSDTEVEKKKLRTIDQLHVNHPKKGQRAGSQR